jgi:hypothetical protein
MKRMLAVAIAIAAPCGALAQNFPVWQNPELGPMSYQTAPPPLPAETYQPVPYTYHEPPRTLVCKHGVGRSRDTLFCN